LSRGALLRLSYGLLTLGVLLFDQLTKAMITSRMALYSSVPVVPGLFHLTLVTNRGALFGLFHDMADPYRGALFTVVPSLAILLILFFQFGTSVADSTAQAGLALILGGALGNLTDRLRLGYVVDFLDFFLSDHHWPAFNLADSSICVGVALLIVDLLAKIGRPDRPAPLPEV
jgi:signal peptidase II